MSGRGTERRRERARDSRGRPVPGLYIRDGRFVAGARVAGRWRMRTLDATTLTEARREREAWLAGIREGRIPTPAAATFADLLAQYQASRQLSERTLAHEQHLMRRHLGELAARRVQSITATDVAAVLRRMRAQYAPWTCVAVYRLLAGTFALAQRRGVIARNPVDGLAPVERPRQRNARPVARLDADALTRLVEAAPSLRWRVALGLAGYAGLRLGEVRALRWRDLDFAASTLTVSRSLLPDGRAKPPKTAAGVRTVPLLPALRRYLVEWRLRSPHSRPDDLVVSSATGGPVTERTLARALAAAKRVAGLDGLEARLSWHALRHSYASVLAASLDVSPATLAALVGHADAGFTLRVYARDPRPTAEIVADVLARAKRAGVGN